MKKIIIIALVLLISGPAFAQKKDLLGVPGGIIHSAATAPAAEANTNVLTNLRAKFTKDLNDDLTSALTLAQQVPAGCSATPPTVTSCQPADATAIPCYQALLSLNAIINSYTPPDGKPHVISDLEQLRIVNRTIQSTNFRDACAPLIQDINTQVTQLVGQVLAVVGGAAKLGIGIP